MVALLYSFFSLSLFKLGITPDGRIVARSSLYGGKAAEVIDIVNKGTLLHSLKGEKFLEKYLFYFHLTFMLQHWASCLREALRSRLLLACTTERALVQTLAITFSSPLLPTNFEMESLWRWRKKFFCAFFSPFL